MPLRMSHLLHKLVTPNRILLLVCMLIFIGLRLVALDQQYLLHDERDLSMTGYAIAHTGKDFMGVPFPLNFPDTNPNSPPFPYYFNALWWLLGLPVTVFAIRLPFVIFTSLLVPAIYSIISQLTHKRSYAWSATIVFISSPWIFHITRLGLDSPLALTLTLIALAFGMRNNFKTSLLFFFLAMNTYQAYRLVVPFLMITVPFIQNTHFDIKKSFRHVFPWIIALAIFSVITLVLNSGTISHRASGELIFTNLDSYSSQIELDRRSLDVRPSIQSIFANKATVVSMIIGQKLVDTLSPSFLFWRGDYSVTGSPFSGSFYPLLLPFLLIGLTGWTQMEKRLQRVVLITLLVGWIPVAIHRGDTAIALRGSLMSFGLTLLIAHGLITTHEGLKSKHPLLKMGLIGLFCIAGSINIVFAAFTYYIRRPPQVAEFFVEKERQIGLKILTSQMKHVVYAQIPQEVALAYLVLSPNFTIDNTARISLSKPQTFYYGIHQYIRCEGDARDFVNTSKDIRVIERSCTDDISAKAIEEAVGESNIIRTSDFSHLPVYYYIPAGVHISIPRQS